MKIQVGGAYVTRYNQIVHITHTENLPGNKIFVGDNYQTYWEDGLHCAEDQSFDLLYETAHTSTAEPPKPKTEILGYNYHQLHPDFIRRVSKIYHEGSKKYGKDNYKQGFKDTDFLNERFNHVMDHLLRYREGDRTEDHLAKIAWWACFMMQSESSNQSTENGTTNQPNPM